MSFRQPSVLPGFGLTFGFTTFFLSAIVLLPLAALALAAASLHWSDFVHVVLSPRALGSYRLSFGASFLAAAINLVFGLIIAWTLVRYEFPGDRKSTRLNSSHSQISYAVFCLKKKNKTHTTFH